MRQKIRDIKGWYKWYRKRAGYPWYEALYRAIRYIGEGGDDYEV